MKKGMEKRDQNNKVPKKEQHTEMPGMLPQVFLRIFPTMNRRLRSECGYMGSEGPKVISYIDNECDNTVNFCLYSEIFGGVTDQRYVLHCFCSDELRLFINGGSSVLFFQDESKFYYHTMLGNAADSGMVPKMLGLLFSTLADFLPEECEFKLSKTLGKIYRLTEADKEIEKTVRDKMFSTKKQSDPEPSTSDNNPNFGSFLYKTLKIDLGLNYLWVSSFAIFDNNVYDLLEAIWKKGPQLVQNWRNKVPGEFPLSYLCRNVHVLSKCEALHLFVAAKSNFEKSLSKNQFHHKRSVFIYCITNLRHRREKSCSRVFVHTLALISFPGLSSVALNSLGETSDYANSIITLWSHMKMSPTFKEAEPLRKNNLLETFLRNLWLRKRKLSMVINLHLKEHKFEKTVTLLRKTCLKQLTVGGINIQKILPIKTDKKPKKLKKRFQKEDLADDIRFSITLKWINIQVNADNNYKPEELKQNNVVIENSNPFLVVDFIVDSDQRWRMTFPQLNPWFTKIYEADIEEIKSLKVKVMILKYLESTFGEMIESKAELVGAKNICFQVKCQLIDHGKLDITQKGSVLGILQKKIDSIIYGPMSFRTLHELVYLQEVVRNNFQYT